MDPEGIADVSSLSVLPNILDESAFHIVSNAGCDHYVLKCRVREFARFAQCLAGDYLMTVQVLAGFDGMQIAECDLVVSTFVATRGPFAIAKVQQHTVVACISEVAIAECDDAMHAKFDNAGDCGECIRRHVDFQQRNFMSAGNVIPVCEASSCQQSASNSRRRKKLLWFVLIASQRSVNSPLCGSGVSAVP